MKVKPPEAEAVATGDGVRRGKTGSDGRRARGVVGTDTAGIERGDLRGRYLVGAAGGVVVDVGDHAIAERVKGNGAVGARRTDDARVVVVEEEEELVLDDGAADVAAELILDEMVAWNDGRSVVVEPAVGYKRRVAVVLVDISVEMCWCRCLVTRANWPPLLGPESAPRPATVPRNSSTESIGAWPTMTKPCVMPAFVLCGTAGCEVVYVQCRRASRWSGRSGRR